MRVREDWIAKSKAYIKLMPITSRQTASEKKRQRVMKIKSNLKKKKFSQLSSPPPRLRENGKCETNIYKVFHTVEIGASICFNSYNENANGMCANITTVAAAAAESKLKNSCSLPLRCEESNYFVHAISYQQRCVKVHGLASYVTILYGEGTLSHVRGDITELFLLNLHFKLWFICFLSPGFICVRGSERALHYQGI